MPDTRDEVNEFLLGSGAKAFSFDSIGDRVRGEIVAMQKRQQTHIDTGEPLFWNNGDPKWMLQVSLQTELHDSDDDEGMRAVYLRGGNYVPTKGKGSSSLNAVKDAVKRSGASDGLQPGGILVLEYSGEAKAAGKAFTAKLYTADYTPPSFGVDLDEMA